MTGQTLKRPSPFAYPGGDASVDPAHPASAGLLISTAARAGNHFNILSGKPAAIVGTPARKIHGRLGETVDFPGVTDRCNFASYPTTAFPRRTTACIFTMNANAAVPIDVCGDSNGSNVGMGLGLDQTSFRFTVRFNSYNIFNTIPSYVVGVPYFFAASANGTDKINLIVVRLDTGQTWTVAVGIASAGNSGIGTYVVGGRDSTSGRNINGPVACTMQSATFLSMEQLRAWAREPWAFWYPQKTDFGGMLARQIVTNASLSADAGNYSITGTAASLKVARKVVAAAGSYAVNGQAATLLKATKVVAAAGSYSLTGSASALLHKWVIPAGAGSYALTGAAATLTKSANKTVAAGAGAYSLSGSAATLTHGWKLAAGAGAYTLIGSAATLTKLTERTIVGGAGAYALSGNAASLTHAWRAAAEVGAYSLSGAAATLRRGRSVAAGAGSYALSGSAAGIMRSYRMDAVGGSYLLTGASANLARRAAVQVNSLNVVYSGPQRRIVYSEPQVRVVYSEPETRSAR